MRVFGCLFGPFGTSNNFKNFWGRDFGRNKMPGLYIWGALYIWGGIFCLLAHINGGNLQLQLITQF